MTPNPRWRIKPCSKCGAPDHMYGRRHLCEKCRKIKVDTPESKQKRAAQYAAAQAVRKGVLVRGPCVVCEARGFAPKGISHGHHEDYSKPLDVIWLCAMHHCWVHIEGLEYVTRPKAAA